MSRRVCASACVPIGFLVLVLGCSGPSREQAEQSMKNMSAIIEALNNYEATHKEFPRRMLMTKDGNPGLSWRVAILPLINEEKLYAEFHLDEPWDSAYNRPLVDKMPAVYQSPMTKAEPGRTNYMAVVGPQAVLADNAPIKARMIVDGTANTVAIVEANDAVEWTKPEDYVPSKDDPAAGLGKLHPKGHFLAGFPSGNVDFVPTELGAKSLNSMFDRNDVDSGKGGFSWNSYKKDKSKTPGNDLSPK